MEFTRQQIGDVELRFLDGKLDEIVLVKQGDCLFHLEYLSKGEVGMSVGDVRVTLYSKAGIRAEVQGQERPVKARRRS